MYDRVESISGCMKGIHRKIIGRIIAWIDRGPGDDQLEQLVPGNRRYKRQLWNCAHQVTGGLAGNFFFFRGAGRRSSIVHFRVISTFTPSSGHVSPPFFEENRQLMRNMPPNGRQSKTLTILLRNLPGHLYSLSPSSILPTTKATLPHRKLQVTLENHSGLDALYILKIFMIKYTHPSWISAVLCKSKSGDVIHSLLGIQSILVVPENGDQPVQPSHTSIVCDCLSAITVHSSEDFFAR